MYFRKSNSTGQKYKHRFRNVIDLTAQSSKSTLQTMKDIEHTDHHAKCDTDSHWIRAPPEPPSAKQHCDLWLDMACFQVTMTDFECTFLDFNYIWTYSRYYTWNPKQRERFDCVRFLDYSNVQLIVLSLKATSKVLSNVRSETIATFYTLTGLSLKNTMSDNSGVDASFLLTV